MSVVLRSLNRALICNYKQSSFFSSSAIQINPLHYELNQSSKQNTLLKPICSLLSQNKFFRLGQLFRPDPTKTKKNLHFKIHYPEDGKYTVKELKVTKLGGRDPETGRIIYGCVGGGRKLTHKWVDKFRVPTDLAEKGDVTIKERVLKICTDPTRTAHVALVGRGNHLRWLIATTSMKEGSIIKSSNVLTRIPVDPKEGDAYPIGSLPLGTKVCCIEILPGSGTSKLVHAGTHAVITQLKNNKVVVKVRTKLEFSLDQRCMVVVGQVSNPEHSSIPIGSPQRLRWLGRRPRSGLWQRKTGRHGRKIKPFKGPMEFEERKPKIPYIQLTAPGEGVPFKVIPSTKRVT